MSDLNRGKSMMVKKYIRICFFSVLYINFEKSRLDLGMLPMCVGVQHVESWGQVAG